jgi:hypothetical protein
MSKIFTKLWSTAEAEFRLREDELVFVHLKEGITVDREKMENLIRSAQSQLGTDDTYPFIIEVGSFTHLAPDGGQFAQMYEGKTPVHSLCIVSDSLSVRLAANFYQAVFKPQFAFKMFQSLREAEVWSLEQRPK